MVIYISLVAFGCWILTLGIFVVKHSDSVASSPTVINTSDDVHVTVTAYVDPSSAKSWGVPYLYQVTSDMPPRPLVTVFRAAGTKSVSAIELTGVFTGAMPAENRLGQSITIADGHQFEGGEEAAVFFSKSIKGIAGFEERCRVRLTGRMVMTNGESSTFDVDLLVPYQATRRVYTGWIKLLYYDQF